MTTYLRDLAARLRWTVDDSALRRNERVVDRQSRAAKDLQRTMSRVGNAIAAAGIARGLQSAADASIGFARTLADLQSLLPGQTARVEELGAGIRKLAVEYGADAEVLSRATYQIISAVGDGADTLDRLALAQQVATAANTDAATAFDLLSAVTLAYGDASIGAQRKVADLAFTAVQFGKTTLPEVAAAVGRAAPAFAALGVSQEELFGLVGALSGVTGSTAEAMTQLAAITAAMTKRTDGMNAAFGKLGVKTAKDLISKRGLVGALRDLRATTDGTAESLGELLGREEAMRAANAITGASAQRVTDSLAAAGRAAGSGAKAFRAAQEGAGRAAIELDKLNVRAAELQRGIGDRVAEPLAKAKLAALGLAEALSDDLTKALDVFGAEANEFAGSRGFQALDALRALGIGIGTAVDLAGSAAGAVTRDGRALGAAAGRAVRGDLSGAGKILSDRERAEQREVREFGSRASFRGLQILGAFGDESAQAQVDQRTELARIALEARKERDRALADRGITRTPEEIQRRRLGSATIQSATIVVPPGTSPEQAQQIVRRGFGEALGDAMGAEVPDPTAAR